jgi:16S rRNA pseudouridine516 synthase
MFISRTRLDRYLKQRMNLHARDVKRLLAQGRIYIDGQAANDCLQIIDKHSHLVLDGECLQSNPTYYLMMNKPDGVVSATRDEIHKTVIDLLDEPFQSELHIAGRLDLHSTGLILLTNDSRWSKYLASPGNKITKHYRVEVANPINEECILAFKAGIYFSYEESTTRPALLEKINDYKADVYLSEGKYHQIKRMFGRFRNPVKTLHRCAIGNITLDPTLLPGHYRALNPSEIDCLPITHR